MGLQQLGPSRFRLYCQPADTTPGQQLPAEQSGGEHRLWSALLDGCSGQWRSNGSLSSADSFAFRQSAFVFHPNTAAFFQSRQWF